MQLLEFLSFGLFVVSGNNLKFYTDILPETTNTLKRREMKRKQQREQKKNDTGIKIAWK